MLERNMGPRDQNQQESQLLAEWRSGLPPYFKIKTQVRVGAPMLEYNGNVLSPAQQRAFSVWNLWVDARIFTGSELWLVEAAIVGKAAKYGQAMDYAALYSSSADAGEFRGAPVVPVVLCAFEIPSTAAFFSRFGVRTILFTPPWAAMTLANKIHQQAIVNPQPV